jgi:uracil-DNA glycosylase
MMSVVDQSSPSDLNKLLKNMQTCEICRVNPSKKPGLPHPARPVFQISEKAPVALCGQAPGLRVHQTGQPFLDPSGDRLRQWLGVDKALFYNSEKFAIIPMGFCFPGYNEKGADLPPRPECRHTWHDQLFALLPQLKVILTIGQYAQDYHLGPLKRPTLTETVRDWATIWQHSNHPHYLPLPHPSWRNNVWLKKNPWFEQELLPFLKEQVAQYVL